MNYEKKWEIIEEIGQGGQGKVFRVYDKTIKLNNDQKIADFLNNIKTAHVKKIESNLDNFFNHVYERLKINDELNHYALKVLHSPNDARDFQLSKERIKNELKAMHDIEHPNLLKIIDFDSSENWFVSNYYSKGTLDYNRDSSFGNAAVCLNLIRPLVEGVAELHDNEIVHRDIKPENIFINSKDELILGDFGLVYFNDNQHTRISHSFSNVGSRDWMPGWAMSRRIEEVNPSFDVFALGKVIWYMISGTPVLPLWYYNRNGYNLENSFPDRKEMKIVNKLLSKCVVEDEEDCIPNANDLLNEIDETLSKINFSYEELNTNNIKRMYKVCAEGQYHLESNDSTNTRNFGLNPAGSRQFVIMSCNNCGHIQMFMYKGESLPPAWN